MRAIVLAKLCIATSTNVRTAQEDRISDDRNVGARRTTATDAERLLTRAAEIDASRASGSSIVELRDAALQAGISPEAFDAAVRGASRDTSVERPGFAEAIHARPRPPFLVRLTMTGVPDRRAAAAYYWMFVAAMIAAPLLAVAWPGRTPVRPVGSLVISAFSFFSLWTTSYAMTWLDEHGWDALRKRREVVPR
jgi:hypothetical protein